jgi:hypothetical protein
VLLYDAESSPGNSGGPVCDRYGNIVAVHGLGFLAGKFAAGIPVAQLREFLAAKPEIMLLQGGAEREKAWEDVIESVGKSTVQVLVYQKAADLKLAKREHLTSESARWDAFEDGWCMTCNGNTLVECPGAGCSNGKIRSTGVEVLGGTANGTAITKRVTKATDCKTCKGHGRVRCPHCIRGIEQ